MSSVPRSNDTTTTTTGRPPKRRAYFPYRASDRLEVIGPRADSLASYLELAGRPAEAIAAANLGDLARTIGDRLDHECPCSR